MLQRPLIDIFTVIIPDAAGTERRVPYVIRGGTPIWLFPTRPPRRVLWRISKHANQGLVILPAAAATALSCGVSVLYTPFVVRWIILPNGGGRVASLVFSLFMAVALTALCDATFLGTVRRIYRPRYVKAALEEGRCPHCMHELRSAPNDDTRPGHMRCTECAAVWAKAQMP